MKVLGPACCACEWSWSLRAVTAVLCEERRNLRGSAPALGAQSAGTRAVKAEAARAAQTRAALSPFALEVSPVLRVRAAPMLQRHTCALTGGVLLMPWVRREFSLDRSDSEEFLSCSFSFVGSPKHPLRGLNGGLSLGSSNRRWCCATVEPGASVDSQAALCGCTVCGFSPREDVAMIMG